MNIKALDTTREKVHTTRARRLSTRRRFFKFATHKGLLVLSAQIGAVQTVCAGYCYCEGYILDKSLLYVIQ